MSQSTTNLDPILDLSFPPPSRPSPRSQPASRGVEAPSNQRTLIGVTPTLDADGLAKRPTVPTPEAREPAAKALAETTARGVRGETMVGLGRDPATHRAETSPLRGETVVGLGPRRTIPEQPAIAEGRDASRPADDRFQPSRFARGPELARPEPIRTPLRTMDTGDWMLLLVGATVLIAMLILLL